MSSVLESLLKKRDELNNKIKSLEIKESARKRKMDTKKKILIGAFYKSKHEREDSLDILKKELDKFLTRKDERALFDLD